MRRWIVPVTLVVVLVWTLDIHAAVITSYDVANARESGFGCWTHVYDDDGIVANGDGTSNYSGGSGTLNDGLLGTSHLDTQLFCVSDSPSITLHLDSATNVSEIKLFSFDTLLNRIPGNLVSVDVTIGDVTVLVTANGFGPATLTQSNSNELLLLLDSGLTSVAAETVTLSGFQATGSWSDFFSISEITVAGNAASGSSGPSVVPEPASLAIWLWGACSGLGAMAVRRRKHAA